MSLEGQPASGGTKKEIIEKFARQASDTGSPEVQVAVITNRLTTLSKHFATHPADKHSKRGMLNLVSRRKRLLQYLKNEDVNRYKETLSTLGLRK
jgi:small subunit ribosomal protein S15